MYKSKLENDGIDRLAEAVLSLKDKEECYRFFEDILTIGEINAMEQRLAVALLLRNGATYQEIVAATGASSATISRINRCINYGSNGYNIVLDRLEGSVNSD